MKLEPQTSGWEAFYADRAERRDAATDDATRQHFEAELDVARITLHAMGLDVPQGKPGEQAAAQDDEVINDAQFVDYDAKSTPAPTESASLSQSLNQNLALYQDDIQAAADATGVPANLLAAVIWDESKGIASAGTVNGENGLTDTGLMQINPDTYADLQRRYPELLSGDASDPTNNIMAGALYLKEQYDQFGSWDLALRAYNSGPLSVDVTDASISTSGFGTQNYVEKVSFYQGLLDQGQVLPDGYPGGNQYY